MVQKKRSKAQIEREIAAALASPAKHKGNRYVGMSGPNYRAGWDAAGGSMRSRNDVIDATEQDVPGLLTVAIDALLEGHPARGLKLIYMTGGLDADLENEAFRNSGLSSQEQLNIRRNPKRTKTLVDAYARSQDGEEWKTGYVDRVLDILEKKAGMREA